MRIFYQNKGIALLEILLVLLLMSTGFVAIINLSNVYKNNQFSTFNDRLHHFIIEHKIISSRKSTPITIYLSKEERALKSSIGNYLLIPQIIEITIQSNFKIGSQNAAIYMFSSNMTTNATIKLSSGTEHNATYEISGLF